MHQNELCLMLRHSVAHSNTTTTRLGMWLLQKEACMLNRTPDLKTALLQKKYYANYIIKYQRQCIDKPQSQQNKGVLSIHSLAIHRRKISRLLVKQIKEQRYQPQSVEENIVRVKEKDRVICKLNPFDMIAQGVISQLITARLTDYISKSVYSVKNRSNYMAARQLGEFFRKHQNKKRCDLFVIRTDISAYTDSIPLTKTAPLWQRLQSILTFLHVDDDFASYLLSLLKQFLRPIIKNEDGLYYQRLLGTPMGSPLSALVATCYLVDVDRLFSTMDDIFYARYGDDIVIIATEEKRILQCDTLLNTHIKPLGLHRNHQKDQLIYLTHCGKPYKNDLFEHSHCVNYVGYSIQADGTLALKSKAIRTIKRDLKRRVRALVNCSKGMSLHEQGHFICQTINRAFCPGDALSVEKVDLLIHCVTNRKQLQDLDYYLAKTIAEQLSAQRGVRAFRHITYKKIRSQWQLHSLNQLRNGKRY